MTVQVGGYPRVCLHAFPSFLPHLSPPLFSCHSPSLLLNRSETLATQAMKPPTFLLELAFRRKGSVHTNLSKQICAFKNVQIRVDEDLVLALLHKNEYNSLAYAAL